MLGKLLLLEAYFSLTLLAALAAFIVIFSFESRARSDNIRSRLHHLCFVYNAGERCHYNRCGKKPYNNMIAPSFS